MPRGGTAKDENHSPLTELGMSHNFVSDTAAVGRPQVVLLAM